MFRKLIVGCVAWFISACAGNLPEPGTSLSAASRAPRPAVPRAPLELTGNDAKDAPLKAKFHALETCDAVALSIPGQQLLVKKRAYNKKQSGLLVTTVVGVAGSVVTAILASKTKVQQP